MMLTYEAKTNKVWKGSSVAVTVWEEKTDETRLPNESWLSMRERTRPARLEAELVAAHRAREVSDMLNFREDYPTQNSVTKNRKHADMIEENRTDFEGVRSCLELLINTAKRSKAKMLRRVPGAGAEFFQEYAVRIAAGRQVGLTTSMVEIIKSGNSKALWITRDRNLADHCEMVARKAGVKKGDIAFKTERDLTKERATSWGIENLENIDFVVLDNAAYLSLTRGDIAAIGWKAPASCLLIAIG